MRHNWLKNFEVLSHAPMHIYVYINNSCARVMHYPCIHFACIYMYIQYQLACSPPPQTLPVKRPDFSQLRGRLEVQLDSGWSSLPAGQRDSLSVQPHPPHVQPHRLSFHQHTPHLILHTLSARETAVWGTPCLPGRLLSGAHPVCQGDCCLRHMHH